MNSLHQKNPSTISLNVVDEIPILNVFSYLYNIHNTAYMENSLRFCWPALVSGVVIALPLARSLAKISIFLAYSLTVAVAGWSIGTGSEIDGTKVLWPFWFLNCLLFRPQVPKRPLSFDLIGGWRKPLSESLHEPSLPGKLLVESGPDSSIERIKKG